jgi:Bacterial transcriptional activator domain
MDVVLGTHTLTITKPSVAPSRQTVVVTSPGAPTAPDLYLFRQLIRAGQAADRDEDGVALLRRAIRLWRGRPFADLDCAQLVEIGHALERDRVEALHD